MTVGDLHREMVLYRLYFVLIASSRVLVDINLSFDSKVIWPIISSVAGQRSSPNLFTIPYLANYPKIFFYPKKPQIL